MRSGVRACRLLAASLLAASVALGATGCRTTKDDVHRWADTVQGPKKLVAVLSHSKYPLGLRVEAAMTLIQMKPRRGKQVGVQGDDDNPGLVRALSTLSRTERARIVKDMTPRLVEEIRRPPPRAPAGQPSPADPSFAYKDAAFALLTQGDAELVSDPEVRKELEAALADWAMVDFARRADESSQMYGTEQILGYLKAAGVRRLPELIEPEAAKIDLMAKLVAELGDRATRIAASGRLVTVAQDVNSRAWIKRREGDVRRANAASKLKPTERQFRAQLEQYQEEQLLRVFASMKRVGQAPIVDYLLRYAGDASQTEKRRAAALAALEGHVDKNNRAQVEAILRLAREDGIPDQVRDQALRRVGEMPRKVVVSDLYALFENDNWKVRWMAGELILKMSDSSQIAEFMGNLRRAEHMALTEAWRYGTLLGSLKGPKSPAQIIDQYAEPTYPVQARVTALGYYFEHGSKADLGKVTRYQQDAMQTPRCKEGAEGCEWRCTVGEGAQQEVKEIGTVGEFVKYCVVPALEKREEKQTEKPKQAQPATAPPAEKK